jgi:hypothetical protein
MAGRIFKTSFGYEIPIIENYLRRMPPPRDNLGLAAVPDVLGAKAPVESDFGIVSDIFQFSMMADWFKTTLASGKQYERMLDINGGTGLIGQLFKAVGIVRAVENVETLDYSESLDADLVRNFLKKIRNGRKESYSQDFAQPAILPQPRRGLARLIPPPPPASFAPFGSLSSREDQVWVQLQLDHMQSTFPYAIDQHSYYWNVDHDVPLKLDRRILGNFLELDDKYDFLLATTSMQYFSVREFLGKAYSLLEPGGVLLIWNAYWYWALIVSRLYGLFPWAVQRLTWEDYARYLKEYQPDQVENARMSADSFHKGEKIYALSDYIAAGEEAGFKQVANHRLMPFSGIKSEIGGWALEGDHGAVVQKDVLRDIHCFRSDIQAADLATQSVFLLFQKE